MLVCGKLQYIMKVYVLYRELSDGKLDIFGFFSTKDKAEKELIDYSVMVCDCNMKIKEVEMDKIISF